MFEPPGPAAVHRAGSDWPGQYPSQLGADPHADTRMVHRGYHLAQLGTVEVNAPHLVALVGARAGVENRRLVERDGIPGDDVENSGPAPSQGCIRPAGPTSHKENTMAKYLLLKHYRGAPAPVNDVPMDQWKPDEVEAHIRFMNDFAARLESSGEFIDGQALSPDGVWVRYDGEGRPPVTDGPFAETKDLIAGWMVIDVDSYERAIELAGELSAAPGAGGEPIHEWLEVRPFLTAPPTVTQ